VRTHPTLAIAAVLATALVVSAPASPRDDRDSQPMKIKAWAVNLSNVGAQRTGTVEFTIDGWTTADQRAKVIDTMADHGQDAMLRLLQKMPLRGRMRFPSWQGPDPLGAQLGWDLRYAARDPLPDGGQRITLLTDRPVGVFEALERPRSIDYPFTLIELHLDRQNEGEGKMSIATKITFDRMSKTMVLENYADQPVLLQKVAVEGAK
jgi:hypothetical protein